MDKAREVALKILYKIEKENAYSNILLNDVINKNKIEKGLNKKEKDKREKDKREKDKKGLNNKDISLISEIVYGVTTWRLTLDEIIKKYSKIRIKKISPWILNILRLSIYQIVFLDKIPKSAAVNEGVNLAKKYGNKGSVGYVNAILRKVDKDEERNILDNIKLNNNNNNNNDNDNNNNYNMKDLETISKCTSMPMWIIEELKNDGLDNNKILDICMNSNIRPNVSIRVNNLKTNRDKLKDILINENVKIKKDGILDDSIILDKVNGIESLESFKKGFFTVQDEVAGLPAIILGPKQNEKILDSCSSPGGKTTYIAELMENNGEILAFDIHEHRVKLVEENAKRLGINNIKTKVEDASIYKEEYKEKFDKILLDVPCLGIGVLKRKPDIKWQKKKADLDEIQKLQMNILNTCSKYLKIGGELVYSTCSIFKKENRFLIEDFLNKNKNFKLVNLKDIIEEKIDNKFFLSYLKNDNFLEVYQNENTDGFFICKLVKCG